jgi:DNA helicase-2/ATP-dependent DNA helicase PcrA
MFIGTTHGWALQNLRELGGIYETLDGIDDEQEWALLLRVARRLGVVDLFAASGGTEAHKVAVAPAMEVFLRSVDILYDEALHGRELASRVPGFVEAVERYEWLLREMRLLPFRSMIQSATEELAPGGRLRQKLDGRVGHVLVDEFQDMNPLQDRLAGYLLELGADLAVVGDDDQAIYQWRGGDVSLFVRFADRYQKAAKTLLGENHRCRPEIVSFAQEVVRHLPGRLDKVIQSAREKAEPGAVEILIGTTPADEASRIAERIETLLQDGHRPSDVAVLFRSVRTSASPLIDELRKRRIPVAVIGKTSLLARPEMCLLAQVFVYWAGGCWYPNPEHGRESVTREGLMRRIEEVTGRSSERADVTMARIERLGEDVKREGVSDIVDVYNELLEILGLPGMDGPPEHIEAKEHSLGQMSDLLTSFHHAVRRATPRALYQEAAGGASDEAQEDAALASEDENDEREHDTRVLGATRGEIYLVRLRSYLEHFAGRAAEIAPKKWTDPAGAVQVMTIHQSKGLEFPITFVPALVEGRFPSAMMGREQKSYVPPDLYDPERYAGREEDESRLLYVALTRAKELLVVSWFEQHRVRAANPSRFVTHQLRAVLEQALPSGLIAPTPAPAAITSELLDTDFSSLVTYQECGYKYKLRHVCGFKPPLVRELGFGKLLHHVVAELARQAARGETPQPSDADDVLSWAFYLPFAGPLPARVLRESIRRRVHTYLSRYGDELRRTIRPEMPFEVPLGHARVHGRIDLMLRADGRDRVELIDFKTSENRPPSEMHVNQLRLYAAAAERLGFEPVKLGIHDLEADDGRRHVFGNDDRERDAFKTRVGAWVEGIRRGDFLPVEDRSLCPTCDFRKFCRYAPAEAKASSPR